MCNNRILLTLSLRNSTEKKIKAQKLVSWKEIISLKAKKEKYIYIFRDKILQEYPNPDN
jgi:hypothetical protein